jgi:hypothetical protein
MASAEFSLTTSLGIQRYAISYTKPRPSAGQSLFHVWSSVVKFERDLNAAQVLALVRMAYDEMVRDYIKFR